MDEKSIEYIMGNIEGRLANMQETITAIRDKVDETATKLVQLEAEVRNLDGRLRQYGTLCPQNEEAIVALFENHLNKRDLAAPQKSKDKVMWYILAAMAILQMVELIKSFL